MAKEIKIIPGENDFVIGDYDDDLQPRNKQTPVMPNNNQEGENIIKGNRIISEFMGLYVAPFNGRYHFVCKEKKKLTDININWEFRLEEAKYHTSWDWLMPVVEKIRSDNQADKRSNNLLSFKIEIIVQGKCFSCQIYKTYWPNSGEYKEDRICGRRDITSLIEVVWQAVVSFIEYYNTTKK